MRLATWEQDRAAILEGCYKLRDYAKSYGFIGTVDFDHGVTSIYNVVTMGNAYIIDGYLVLVAEVEPWYTKDILLQEWLVIKVYPTVNGVKSIPPALLEIAKERGCVMLLTGDSSPVNIMANAYKDAGFHNLTQSFYKEP